MGNKTLAYIGLGVILLLLVGTFAMGGITRKVTSDTNDMTGHHSEGQPLSSSSEELDKYRSEKIPEECRLPEYEDDLNSWKEHLSHHENTLYCLDYYNNGGE